MVYIDSRHVFLTNPKLPLSVKQKNVCTVGVQFSISFTLSHFELFLRVLLSTEVCQYQIICYKLNNSFILNSYVFFLRGY